MADVTQILNAIEKGDPKAAEELFPLVYEELRLLAAQKMSQELPGQTLQATALVHEAFIRLVEGEHQNWKSRTHFFKAAAEAMRRILVENARRKKRLKRGGSYQRLELTEGCLAIEAPSDELIALDEALKELAIQDPKAAELVQLTYFGGLTIGQAAEILDVSPRTVYRQISFARAWLYDAIGKKKA